MKRLLCLFGFHDLHAPCEGFEKDGPPEGHPCRPQPHEPAWLTLQRFAAWTRLECSRCGYVPKVCR